MNALVRKPNRPLYCGECKWYSDEAANEGICRFHPPVPNRDPEEPGIWPRVIRYDGCSKAEWNHNNLDSEIIK